MLAGTRPLLPLRPPDIEKGTGDTETTHASSGLVAGQAGREVK
jgi:hypothetical protein